jgi:6,7-dimethyl-8-ribityllumazine synthase
MQDADRGLAETPGALDGEGLRVAVVRARFNDAITLQMTLDCEAELRRLGVLDKHLRRVDVPGALEIPTVLNVLAESGDFDALVAIGCVIRGETYHFELVSDQSAQGVMTVSLEHQLPIANAILTVENLAQAQARAATHGAAAARVAVEMANVMDEWV